MSHGHHQPYDPYYQLPPAAAAPGGEWNSGINTLFVSGLPDDVKAREIHNIFRRRPGFDSCQLKYTGRGNQVRGKSQIEMNNSRWTSLNMFVYFAGCCFCYLFQSPISHCSFAFFECEPFISLFCFFTEFILSFCRNTIFSTTDKLFLERRFDDIGK